MEYIARIWVTPKKSVKFGITECIDDIISKHNLIDKPYRVDWLNLGTQYYLNDNNTDKIVYDNYWKKHYLIKAIKNL
jgi:hypothetical protein